MQKLWTPSTTRFVAPKVSRQHREGTRAWETQVLSSMHTVGGVLDHWNRELKQIDPNLRLMQAHDRAECAGVIAGYYHLVRLRDPGRDEMLMVVPLRGPNNEFVELTGDMLEALRLCDLQNDQALEAKRNALAREEASAARATANEEEERLEEGIERFKAASRTQILTSPDVPWTQNNSPASRRDRGERKRA